LVVRVIGDTIAFCPPLIITEEQSLDLVSRFTRVLDTTAEFVRKESIS
jgi:4-aminobutyrate--pyruvate transaminase